MNKKILYLINDLPFFVSHRLPIAEEAFKKGYSINLLTGKSASQIMNANFKNNKKLDLFNIKELNFESSSTHFLKNIFFLVQIVKNFLLIKPDIVHLVSLKPIILGGLACRFLNIKNIVISFSGFGYLFTGKTNFKKKFYKKLILFLLKLICKNNKKIIICQNNYDKNFILENNLANFNEVILIKGSGVDINLYENIKYKISNNLVLMPSRILKNKGVIEFLEACKILYEKGINWNFILIGAKDYKNPSSVDSKFLDLYDNKYNIKIFNHNDNLIPLYQKAGIVCLPSHREGIPKSIIEALCAGIPVVTTDTIGCNESILPGVNGDLALLENPKDLANKLENLILNDNKRLNYSSEAKKFAREKYNLSDVIYKHMNIYNNFFEN